MLRCDDFFSVTEAHIGARRIKFNQHPAAAAPNVTFTSAARERMPLIAAAHSLLRRHNVTH